MAARSTEFAQENHHEQYVRLHITPLDPSILPSIVHTSLLPKVRNISYHSIQTFPEKPYGFVELPVMEAQKIKKKLNGAILKGTKVRIEDARPEKRLVLDEDGEQSVTVKKDKTSKKRRRDAETVPAVELQDRKVKRGWTDPEAPARSERKKAKNKKEDKKDKKEAVRSKYTSVPECLFRTTLPANVAAGADGSCTVTNNRTKKREGKEVTIHEFSKTVKHATFLRHNAISSTSNEAAAYVDKKGWVNRDGEVIEAPSKKKHGQVTRRRQESIDSVDSDASSDIEDPSEDESAVEMEVVIGVAPRKALVRTEAVEDSTSSSGESSDEGSDVESDSTSDYLSKKDESPTPETPDETSRPMSSSGTPIGLTISIPKLSSSPEQKVDVHPLEALYKRRRPDGEAPKVTNTPPAFSFFGPGEDKDEDENHPSVIPMTPFTQQDFAHRGQRSAAPTPDTAHPSRLPQIRWQTGKDDEDAEMEDADYFNTPSNKQQDAKLASTDLSEKNVTEFDRLFYEHRGEHNRAWKKQAKVAAKEKRNCENRKRRERVA